MKNRKMANYILKILPLLFLGAAEAFYNPAYSGIKIKSFQHDPPIAQSFEQQQIAQPHNLGATGERLSPAYGSNDYGQSQQHYASQQQRFVPQQQHYVPQQQHYAPQQQPQQQPTGDIYNQHNLPLYQRPTHEHNRPAQPYTNWNTAAEDVIDEYYTGCPAGYTGQIPYAYDCRRFVNCWHGRGHIQSCGPGTVFNPETLECDRPEKVVCATLNSQGVQAQKTQSAQPTPWNRSSRLMTANTEEIDMLCPAGVTGLHPHPTDCTKFLNCANGNVHEQHCGPGTAFSVAMKVCDFIDKVDCSGRRDYLGKGAKDAPSLKWSPGSEVFRDNIHESPTTSVLEKLPKCSAHAKGLRQHPTDCTKYINCADGITEIHQCSDHPQNMQLKDICTCSRQNEEPLKPKFAENLKQLKDVDKFNRSEEVADLQNQLREKPFSEDLQKQINEDSFSEDFQKQNDDDEFYSDDVQKQLKGNSLLEDDLQKQLKGNTLLEDDLRDEQVTPRNPTRPQSTRQSPVKNITNDKIPYTKPSGNNCPCPTDGASVQTPQFLNIPMIPRGQSPPRYMNNPERFSAPYIQMPEPNQNRIETEAATEEVSCPTGFIGLRPHPFDRKKFLNCANDGITHVQICAPGTSFNSHIGGCDFDRNVNNTPPRGFYGNLRA